MTHEDVSPRWTYPHLECRQLLMNYIRHQCFNALVLPKQPVKRLGPSTTERLSLFYACRHIYIEVHETV